jgi:hypothetical protein
MSLLEELKKRRADLDDRIGQHDNMIATHARAIEELTHQACDLDVAIAALQPDPIPELETQTGEEVEIPPGFTKWEGGEWCPVDPGDRVEIIHPNGKRSFGSPVNVGWQWLNSSAPNGIIAYRVLDPLPSTDDYHSPEFGDEVLSDEPDDASEFAADDTQASATEAANRIEGASEVVTSPGEVGESRDHFALIDQQTCEPVLPHPEWNEDVVATRTYMDGDKLVVREITADEFYAPMPESEPPTEGYAPVTNPEADAQAKAYDYYSPENVEKRSRFDIFSVFKREPEGV